MGKRRRFSAEFKREAVALTAFNFSLAVIKHYYFSSDSMSMRLR